MTPDQIDNLIKSVVREGEGFGGQCAGFAVVLNKVLGGEGTYLAADGQHYEFVEHVALMIDGELYDASGRITMEQLERYAEPDDDEAPTIIEIDDEQSIRALVDSTGGGIYPPLNEERLEKRLLAALADANSPAP